MPIVLCIIRTMICNDGSLKFKLDLYRALIVLLIPHWLESKALKCCIAAPILTQLIAMLNKLNIIKFDEKCFGVNLF